MAPLLRLVLDETRLLHRSVWRWVLGVFVPVILLLRLQEPAFFRRAGVPIFWSGVQAILVMFLALLPLAWILGRGDEGSRWTLRHTLRPTAITAAASTAIFAYGMAAAVVLLASGYTLDRLLGQSPPAALLLRAPIAHGVFLLPLAALAPALHHGRIGSTATVVVWVALLGTSLGLFGRGFPVPADTVLPALEPSAYAARLDLLAIAALSAAGGFALSLAVVRFRLSS